MRLDLTLKWKEHIGNRLIQQAVFDRFA
ncbi:MAG: hypothetical protein RJB09_2541, partial [Pseudomonadota bacterium]